MFKPNLTRPQHKELSEYLRAHPDDSVNKVLKFFIPRFKCTREDIIGVILQTDFEPES